MIPMQCARSFITWCAWQGWRLAERRKSPRLCPLARWVLTPASNGGCSVGGGPDQSLCQLWVFELCMYCLEKIPTQRKPGGLTPHLLYPLYIIYNVLCITHFIPPVYYRFSITINISILCATRGTPPGPSWLIDWLTGPIPAKFRRNSFKIQVKLWLNSD